MPDPLCQRPRFLCARNERSTKDCAPTNVGQNLMELREHGASNAQRAYEIRRYKLQKLERDTLTRLWTRKFFSLLLIDYSMVWHLRAIENGSVLVLSCEILDRICRQEDAYGRFFWKQLIVKRRNGVKDVTEYT
jgi:hypothetical protein